MDRNANAVGSKSSANPVFISLGSSDLEPQAQSALAIESFQPNQIVELIRELTALEPYSSERALVLLEPFLARIEQPEILEMCLDSMRIKDPLVFGNSTVRLAVLRALNRLNQVPAVREFCVEEIERNESRDCCLAAVELLMHSEFGEESALLLRLKRFVAKCQEKEDSSQAPGLDAALRCLMKLSPEAVEEYFIKLAINETKRNRAPGNEPNTLTALLELETPRALKVLENIATEKYSWDRFWERLRTIRDKELDATCRYAGLLGGTLGCGVAGSMHPPVGVPGIPVLAAGAILGAALFTMGCRALGIRWDGGHARDREYSAYAAGVALDLMGQKIYIPEIERFLSRYFLSARGHRKRSEVASMLKGARQPETTAALLKSLPKGSPAFKSDCINALSTKLDQPEVYQAISAAKSDPELLVREAAIRCMRGWMARSAPTNSTD